MLSALSKSQGNLFLDLSGKRYDLCSSQLTICRRGCIAASHFALDLLALCEMLVFLWSTLIFIMFFAYSFKPAFFTAAPLLVLRQLLARVLCGVWVCVWRNALSGPAFFLIPTTSLLSPPPPPHLSPLLPPPPLSSHLSLSLSVLSSPLSLSLSSSLSLSLHIFLSLLSLTLVCSLSLSLSSPSISLWQQILGSGFSYVGEGRPNHVTQGAPPFGRQTNCGFFDRRFPS